MWAAGILREVYLRRVDTFDFLNVYVRPSLKCPDCDQRLFEGELPDEDSYDDGAEG